MNFKAAPQHRARHENVTLHLAASTNPKEDSDAPRGSTDLVPLARGERLLAIAFPNPKAGWFVGNNGPVLKISF